MIPVDELRPLSAARLLALWRDCREAADDPLERTLLCNARVLAESCFYQGEPVFRDGEAVLELLTTREMEGLLRRLSSDTALGPAEENPVFDEARFEALWEG